MKPEQLELFPRTNALSPERPAGGVPAGAHLRLAPLTMPFPVDRQIAYIRKIARAIDARDERLAAKYWRTECNRLVGRLQAQGFLQDIIQLELRRFAVAVGRERARNCRQQPGGAA